MPPQQQQQPKQGMTLDDKIHTIVALGQFAARPTEPFLRVPGTAGERYWGFHAFVGLMTGFLWIACTEPVLAVHFFWATIAMLVVHKVAGRWMRAPGEHSWYNGYPWLSQLLRLDEVECKGPYEFLLVLMTGSVLWGSGHPGLGSWLVVSAVGLAISSAYINQRNNAIDRARNDALAMQRITMQRWEGKARPARKSKLRLVLLLALLAGAGWWIYSGRVEIPASVAAWLPRPAPLSEEEKLRRENEEENRRWEAQMRAEQAREEAQRRAWRRWNAGYY